MSPWRRFGWVAVLVTCGSVWAEASCAEDVVTLRMPEGGRLPRATVDSEGTVHLVYVEGDADAANLSYVTLLSGDVVWSEPQEVNRATNSVAGTGPIDGGQLALGPDDRLHVVWLETNPAGFFYARGLPDRSGFEMPRNLWAGAEETAGVVEASPTVTVDTRGQVFVFWHAGAMEDARRSVYLTVSRDGGTTFEPVRRVSPSTEGACACCAVAAVTGADDGVYVSYRGAGDNVRRGQRLLTSTDSGRQFSDRLVQPWSLQACPVSTTTVSSGSGTVKVAWETQGQVYVAHVDRPETAVSPAGSARFRRKNPVVAVNARGAALLAWGDGPGFSFGGTLHWQVFDADGQAMGEPGTGPALEGSFAAVVVVDDRFVVIH